MNYDRTGLWLRQREHIRAHLWHIYSAIWPSHGGDSNLPTRNPCSVTSLLASIKEIIIGITSSGISDQLRYMYSICRCCWNVATYKWISLWRLLKKRFMRTKFDIYVFDLYPFIGLLILHVIIRFYYSCYIKQECQTYTLLLDFLFYTWLYVFIIAATSNRNARLISFHWTSYFTRDYTFLL